MPVQEPTQFQLRMALIQNVDVGNSDVMKTKTARQRGGCFTTL